jgi:hypothetical protein
MSESNESDDWVEGGTLEAEATELTFFGGACVPVDVNSLPDNDEPLS